MSQLGQTRKSAVAIVRSGLPVKADSTRKSRHVRKVPIPVIEALPGRCRLRYLDRRTARAMCEFSSFSRQPWCHRPRIQNSFVKLQAH
jgi:hypothetical protein